MQYFTSKITLFLLLFLPFSLSAKIISIDKNTTDINILKESSYFLDNETQLSPNKVLQSPLLFKKSTKEFLNFGYIFKDTLWVKAIIQNSSDKSLTRYFTINAPNLSICNLYILDKNNNLEAKKKSGVFQRKTFKSELFLHFKISLLPHEKKIFIFEMHPLTHSLHFHIQLQSYDKYKITELHHQLLLTLFFSILLVTFVYTISISIYSDNQIYPYYAFFIIMIFIHHLSLSGMMAYLLQDNQTLIYQESYMPIYYLAAVVFAIFLFVNKFLHLHNYKKIYFTFQLLMLLITIIFLFNSSENYLLKYMTPLAIFFAFYLEVVSIYLSIKQKEIYAKYFAYIWGISLSGMIFTMLYYLGILTKQLDYLFEVTVVFEIFAFSIILSKQIHTLQEENHTKNTYLQRQTKLAAMGEMLQNISHQWRQPLSELNAVAMKIDADFYTKKITKQTLDKDIERIEHITEHMSQTIENFNDYLKESSQKEVLVNLSEVIYQTIRLINTKLETIHIKVDIKTSVQIKLIPNILIQILHILLINSTDALKNRELGYKKITLTLKEKEKKIFIEVEDNAGGIDEKIINKIFEPYFTTKFQSNGIGIGLYMAKMLVENSLKGELHVQNTKEGALFSIII